VKTDIKDFSVELEQGFRIGDVVKTMFGEGQIIGCDDFALLVQIDGYEGHNGSYPLKYGEKGKNNDCRWLSDEDIKLIKSATVSGGFKITEPSFQEKVFQSLLRFHCDCDCNITFKIINGVLKAKAITDKGGVWVDCEISIDEHETFKDNFLDSMDESYDQILERR